VFWTALGPLTRTLCCLTGWRDSRRKAGAPLCTPAAALAALVALGAAAPVLAQTGNPDDARVQFESLAVSPAIRLTNVGWDDNVLHASKADGPTRDFMATVSPVVEAWLRLPRVRISGRSEVDFIYFKELSQIRSIDTDNSARVELLLGRLTPFVGGDWANTRHRRNLEIDAPVRRLEASWDAGIDVRLTPKTSIGVMTRRSRLDYKGDTVYLDTDLAHYLGATTSGHGVRFRYALTPLTTLELDAQQYRNEFAIIPERNSDAVRVTSGVEFKPLALVSGRAHIGVLRRTFVDGNVPQFQGMFARIDLSYTLLGRTQFALGVQRDLASSYRADQRDYLQAGVQFSVTHRLTSAWDVGGTLGRFGLNYGLGDSSGTGTLADMSPAERVLSYGADVGYRVGSTRVGFQIARQARTSDFSRGRDYERTRIASSLTYVF
jgi:hypothetical protein